VATLTSHPGWHFADQSGDYQKTVVKVDDLHPRNHTRTNRTEKHRRSSDERVGDCILTSKSRCSVYFKAFKPLIMNWNTVFKFSGDGAVTNIFEYP
jgi:hypothetical protein